MIEVSISMGSMEMGPCRFPFLHGLTLYLAGAVMMKQLLSNITFLCATIELCLNIHQDYCNSDFRSRKADALEKQSISDIDYGQRDRNVEEGRGLLMLGMSNGRLTDQLMICIDISHRGNDGIVLLVDAGAKYRNSSCDVLL